MFFTKIDSFNKALFLSERRVHWSSAFFLLAGLKKINGWKKLHGFRRSSKNFSHRLALDGLNLLGLASILGPRKVYPRLNCDLSWVQKLNTKGELKNSIYLKGKFPAFDEFLERGVITPYSLELLDAIAKVQNISEKAGLDTNIFLTSVLQAIEQMILRPFVLELNVFGIKNKLLCENESEQYRMFLESFDSPEFRQRFLRDYAVLSRMVVSRLELWVNVTEELILRLAADRPLLESELGISTSDVLQSIKPAGDTHNGGRSVTVLFFRSGAAVVYKPRSTSIEEGFQKYIGFFNSIEPTLKLRQIGVINKRDYGWVEFVKHSKPQNGRESALYHYKLGFLTAIVFSLNGVDIFFENLISAGADPVIIDLESMFHTPIDSPVDASPVTYSHLRLHESVTGIGVLPNPGRGSTEDEVFDISVLGAKVNARAPYNVPSIENFGRGDMRITETPGWIHETTSSSTDGTLDRGSAKFVFDGLSRGLGCLRSHSNELCAEDGVIRQYFSDAERRLIVRDTKVYGSLLSDESHPDLLRDQVDREWHLDNLWSETIKRPHLLQFIKSEILQARKGDIPYFTGPVNSPIIKGGDGAVINLKGVLKDSPISKVISKLSGFSEVEEREQVRLAATALGLDDIKDVTQPNLRLDQPAIANALEIVAFISRRAKVLGDSYWSDTSFNPVPAAKNIDPVNVTPSNPFLYDGIIGIAMFFYDVWRVTGANEILRESLTFTDSVLKEVEFSREPSPSGFVGLSSIIYVLNRAISTRIRSFDKYDSDISRLLKELESRVAQEEKIDFLLGIAGVGSAILPCVKRTGDRVGIRILQTINLRLQDSAQKIISTREKVEGLDYLRGLSHGISGIALSLYRIGRFLNDPFADNLVSKLLELEYGLTISGGWTDGHSLEGRPLVGWCHGSAGIVLALSKMPHITSKTKHVSAYYDSAFENTFKSFELKSKCLCHGSLGNLLCAQATGQQSEELGRYKAREERSLLRSGFKSLGAAQTMGVGLMTGLAGAGYYLLGQDHPAIDFGFLTLE